MVHAEQLQADDPAGAARLWAKGDRDLTDAAPWLAYADQDVLELLSSRIGNYQWNPVLGTLLDQLWVR